MKNIEFLAKKKKKVSLKNEKQRVTEYRRRYFEMQKNKNTSQIKTDRYFIIFKTHLKLKALTFCASIRNYQKKNFFFR